MKAKWHVVALGCAVVAAGCGQGRAIFNVDVYSFLKGTGKDTLRLPPDPLPPLPPSTTVTDSVTPIAVNLPGAGSSIVDTVRLIGTLDVTNQAHGVHNGGTCPGEVPPLWTPCA